MRRNRLLFLLALLIAAATGAWAQDAKHRITATLNFTSTTKQKTLDVTLPYETTIGAVYTAIIGQAPPSSLSPTAAEVTSGTNVSIGGLNGWDTPVNVTADGDATVGFTATVAGNGINGTITLSVAPIYAVKLADGTQDAKNWTIASGDNSVKGDVADGLKGLSKGDAVTLTYNGRLKVKNVTATTDAKPVWDGDLSKLTAESTAEFATATDGMTIKGTLGANVKVSIADGATVKLDGVSINGVNSVNYMWAGITCLGDATIILSGTNTVKGFFKDYPGIQAAAAGKTLIINGTGSLTASSYGLGAGIGGKRDVACGDIEIQGGTITATSESRGAGIGGGDNASCGNITISGGNVKATGGVRGAGIGGGRRGTSESDVSCGNILISGGTVTATGGAGAAGIGGGRSYNSGMMSSCGTITITTGVTKVSATKGSGAPHSIGKGLDGSCGTVTIGGVVYWKDNTPVNDGANTYLGQATIIYPEPKPQP